MREFIREVFHFLYCMMIIYSPLLILLFFNIFILS